MRPRPLVPGTFRAPLQVEKLDVRRWRLLAPLVFDSVSVGRITVPAGFITDFSSVPRWPLVYWLAGGIADEPAVLHDYCYRRQHVSRLLADAVFFEAMGADGTASWRRWLMWLGVRLGGGVAWRPDAARR